MAEETPEGKVPFDKTKLRRCYLMINDLPGTGDGDVSFEFAFNLGLDENELPPDTVQDMTPSQEATWNMFNVLKGMVDNAHRAMMEAETRSKILVPDRPGILNA